MREIIENNPMVDLDEDYLSRQKELEDGSGKENIIIRSQEHMRARISRMRKTKHRI